MMRTIGVLLTGGILTLTITICQPAYAMSLEEAKAKGLVGEKPDGYLGIVSTSSPEVHKLTDDVNQKRRRAYEDIAKRHGTQVDAVETLAGQKAIQNTKSGHYVEGPGGWKKK